MMGCTFHTIRPHVNLWVVVFFLIAKDKLINRIVIIVCVNIKKDQFSQIPISKFQ